jgi:hypothetical protein
MDEAGIMAELGNNRPTHKTMEKKSAQITLFSYDNIAN